MKYRITITEVPCLPENDTQLIPAVEVFSLLTETLDLPFVVATLIKKPRKRRRDSGKTRDQTSGLDDMN